MKKQYLISLIFSIFSVSLFSQTGYLHRIETPPNPRKGIFEQYGYADEKGKIIIPIGKYPMCYTDTIRTIGFVFSEEEHRIIAIDKSDKKLFTVFYFDNGPDYVKEWLFRIVDDSTGYIGFADMNGNVIIEPRFFSVDYFSEGLAAFNTGGKWGYIDKTGKEVFPAVYDKAFPFENREAKVQIDGYSFYLYNATSINYDSIDSKLIAPHILNEDSIANSFCRDKKMTVYKGKKEDCLFYDDYLKATFEGIRINDTQIIDIKKSAYCVKEGQIIIGNDSKELSNNVLVYYFVTFEKTDTPMSRYISELKRKPYDAVSPVVEAPDICYLLTKGDKLVVLSFSEWRKNAFENKDVEKLIELIKK